jgi:hypothetical protein
MRVLLVLLALVAVARADDKALVKFRGQIIVAKDAPPPTAGELPKYLEDNWSKDGHYERLGGAPWEINIVGVLSKDVGNVTVTLVFSDAGKPVNEVEVTAKGRLVIAHVQATKAAGFEPHKVYVLAIKRGDAVLAKSDLMLRD